MVEKHFDIDSYYSRLKTKHLGRPCIYLQSVESTIDVATKQSPCTIVMAREQLKGRGQSKNIWESPIGCAMGSLKISLGRFSYVSSKLPFLQHILVLSLAKTLELVDPNRLGKRNIRLKWPNDIMYKHPENKSGLKLGGVLVNTKVNNDDFDVTLSFGVNVFNSKPTTCINQLIDNDKKISIDWLVANTLNKLEDYIYDLDDDRFLELKTEYLERCVHTDKIVEDENHGRVLVKSVNDDGYLMGKRCVDQRLCMVTKIASFEW